MVENRRRALKTEQHIISWGRLRIFKLLLTICCLVKVSTSEESSIIAGAKVKGINVDYDSSQGNLALIDNSYRSIMKTQASNSRSLIVEFA